MEEKKQQPKIYEREKENDEIRDVEFCARVLGQ